MRTSEQKAADEALTAAIEAVTAAYWPDEERGILMEYIVCGAAMMAPDDDGDGRTALVHIMRDGDLPHHRAIGLLETVRARLVRQATDDDDD